MKMKKRFSRQAKRTKFSTGQVRTSISRKQQSPVTYNSKFACTLFAANLNFFPVARGRIHSTINSRSSATESLLSQKVGQMLKCVSLARTHFLQVFFWCKSPRLNPPKQEEEIFHLRLWPKELLSGS